MLPNGSGSYFVFPPYGREFRDMDPWVDHWHETFRGAHRFWRGFAGGGILGFPLSMPLAEASARAWTNVHPAWDHPYGMVLGNASGRMLAFRVLRAIPDRPPACAVKAGLAEFVPEMTVAVTVEHLDALAERRFLLVVPRARRRSLEAMDRLPDWFHAFGISVAPPCSETLPTLRQEMRDWFDDPGRLMHALPMTGGEEDAAWQLAAVCYVAQHWETKARGLNSVHLLANVEGGPNFRKNWTSNKYI